MVSMSDRAPETGRCPVCGKPREARFRPFCSKRCADVDLARWLKGTYAIPAQEGAEDSKTDEPVKEPDEPVRDR